MIIYNSHTADIYTHTHENYINDTSGITSKSEMEGGEGKEEINRI